MRPRNTQPGVRTAGRAAALALAAFFLVSFLVGCSDDAPPKGPEAVTGKTPVVRPEDVHVRGPGGAAVLAPDYRQGLTADLPAAGDPSPARGGTVPAAGPTPPRPVAGQAAPGPAGRAEPPAAPGRPPSGTAGPSPLAAELRPADAPAAEGGRGEAGRVDGPVQARSGSGRPAASTGFPVPGCRQLVLVVAPTAEADRGVLRRFTRQGPDAPWIEAGASAPCLLGRKGLGVGRGLTPPLPGPAKRQGDGRTPSGFFPLPAAFGYADAQAAQAAGVRLPYVPVTDRTACVTDPASDAFNRVVGPGERMAGGTRQERMVRDDRANVWGVEIGHNRDHPDAEAGSCVFVNVRPAGGPPTGGSIGCPEAVTAALAAWLDPDAEPVLAVLSAPDYQDRQSLWGLP